MAQTIRLKRQIQSGALGTGLTPTVGMLQDGELAMNTVDGKLFLKKTPVVGSPVVVEVGANPFPDQSLSAGKFLSTDGTSVHWTLPSTVSAAAIDVVQSGHDFTVGTIVYHDGTHYVRSQANSVATADVVGIISAVNGTTSFTLTINGHLDNVLTGLTPGQTYFLSATAAGVMTDIEPTLVGQVSKPVLIANSSTSGFFYNWRGVANDIPVTAIDTLLPTQSSTTIGKALVSNGANAYWGASGGGSGASSTIPVLQVAHTFVVGTLVRYSGIASSYVKAQADSGANADVVGIVSTVTAADNFIVTTQGVITGLAGLVAGASYFLSDSVAGAYTVTEPTLATSVSKPVLIAVSTNTALFSNWRGFGLATLAPLQEVATQTGNSGKFLSTNGAGTLWSNPVVTFNTRSGAVVLSSTDVSTALGYVPYNGSLNPNGYISASSSVTAFNGRVGSVSLISTDISNAGGALLTSPALTGVPTATTASTGTNTTQIATTAFVANMIAVNPGPQGIQGIQGIQGPAGTVSTTTNAVGSYATCEVISNFAGGFAPLYGTPINTAGDIDPASIYYSSGLPTSAPGVWVVRGLISIISYSGGPQYLIMVQRTS